MNIANGETKILEASGSPGEFVRVTRSTASDLSGTATVSLSLEYNNGVGFDNVSSAEAEAGDTEYRALMIKNENAAQVKSVKVYLKTLGTQRVSGAAQLAASGAGSVEVSAGNLEDWPDTRLLSHRGQHRHAAGDRLLLQPDQRGHDHSRSRARPVGHHRTGGGKYGSYLPGARSAAGD